MRQLLLPLAVIGGLGIGGWLLYRRKMIWDSRRLLPDQVDALVARGVITHSSGNFAAALALAASSLDTKAYIVMPTDAPTVKRRAVEGYGANIIECKPGLSNRESTMQQYQKKSGATFIHPSNDMNVILGNSTAVMEMANP